MRKTRTRIKNGLAKDIYGIEIDEEQYKKCIDNLDEVLKRNDIDKVDWKVINADYLKWNTTIKFQYIVGNPPYITYSELKEEEQLFVKSNFSTCVKGKFDYCYAFIEKSINSLADNGKMSYLIPSSIYKTVFGHNLRIFMSPYIAQIKDYKQVKIFDKALVKSSIMILDKQRQQEFLHYQDMSMENAIDIPIAQLDEKWFFADENEVGQHRFGDYFKVSHVVATLLNKAYVLQDGTYIEVEKGYVCGNHTIERAVIRSTETPRTLRYGKHEKIIFPYTYDENGLVRFGEGEFERLYPEAAAYLNEFRDDLSKRQSDNSAKWYEYGRSQALSGLNSKKLLISTVVTNDVDVYELEQECILETAKRELYEETGAINFEINPICIYSVTAPDNFDGKETFGKLFFAEIHTFEKDLHSEIEKIAIMNELPLNWTYPEIQPRLLEEARQRGFLPKKDEIKWLFFDVGSTLVDESRVYEDRMKKIAELSSLTSQQIYEHAISLYRRNKKGDLEIAKQLGIELPKWESQYEKLYTDSEDCLKRLSRNYEIGIIANQPLGTSERLENLGVRKYIDLVIASAEEGVSKPDRRIFEIALERSGCKPENAVMIGDRIDNDIVPAKQLGMKTIWIKQGFGSLWTVMEESEKADIEVNNLSDILNYL